MASKYDPGILGLKSPERCGCQELLAKKNLVRHGWLRKRSLRNKLQLKLIKWPQQYVIIHGKCLYYFGSEMSKHPDGAISLYGFNRIVRAGDLKTREAPWAFKLEHIQPDIKSLYFAASSETEMIAWMKAIKAEMFVANNLEHRAAELRPTSDEMSFASSTSWDSSEYRDLESSIYMDPVAPRMSSIFDHPPDGEGDDTDSDDNYHAVSDSDEEVPPPTPPPRLTSSSKAPEGVDQGYSLQKRLSPGSQKIAPPGYSAANDNTNYWQAVYYDGNRTDAARIINRLATEGVYMVRKSEDGTNVLVVYTDEGPKKYRVKDMETGQCTLSAVSGPNFESLEELLYHYYNNDLPNSDAKLVIPYKLHEHYK